MLSILAWAMMTFGAEQTQTQHELGPALAQARTFSATQGDHLWRGYATAPFEMLLIEAERETLFCPAFARDGFQTDGTDAATGCARLTRARSGLPNTALAALPILGPPSTIVMGTPATTGRTPAEWTRTILHEHFHQWQWVQDDYYARMAALDLAGDDQTGMWMLNFAFPYEDAVTGDRYRTASLALADALAARGTPDFAARVVAFGAARKAFAAQAGERNWRYIDFQLWQEGVARWTEIELGKRFPDADVQASARALEARTLASLRDPDLAKQRRELAYPYGAGEAMLLEACLPGWRTEYPRLLALTPLVERAISRCLAGRSLGE